MAVATGVAKAVVCYRAFNERSGFRFGGAGRQPGVTPLWMAPYAPFGFMTPAAWVALHAQRYMTEYGVTNADFGKIAVIDDPDALDILPMKRKSVSVHWESMFTKSLFDTADLHTQHELLTEVAALVDRGVLRTTRNRTLGEVSATNVRAAHEAQESGRSIGKTVLVGWP